MNQPSMHDPLLEGLSPEECFSAGAWFQHFKDRVNKCRRAELGYEGFFHWPIEHGQQERVRQFFERNYGINSADLDWRVYEITPGAWYMDFENKEHPAPRTK